MALPELTAVDGAGDVQLARFRRSLSASDSTRGPGRTPMSGLRYAAPKPSLAVALGASHALVGGLAVSARAEPRTTRDVDLAVLVAGDEDAERILFALRARGYEVATVIEQTLTKRVATARLRQGAAA